MDAIDEKHRVVFRDNQYTVIHLLTLDIIELLQQAKRRVLSDEQALAGITACVEIREMLDNAHAETIKKYVKHNQADNEDK